jgi:hypothetical protein
MSIKPLQDWKDALEALPKVGDASWALAFADFYEEMILQITTDPSIMTPVGFTFTFNKAIFAAQLATLAPTPDALAGITGFANAWNAAVLSTIVVVGPGTVYGSPSPATTFSAVVTSLINPASIAAGQAIILTLATEPPVGDPQDSKFPEKFRDATLALMIDVTGINSIPPPAGPLPLVALLVPLV